MLISSVCNYFGKMNPIKLYKYLEMNNGILKVTFLFIFKIVVYHFINRIIVYKQQYNIWKLHNHLLNEKNQPLPGKNSLLSSSHFLSCKKARPLASIVPQAMASSPAMVRAIAKRGDDPLNTRSF
jgi:hypothetical protein